MIEISNVLNVSFSVSYSRNETENRTTDENRFLTFEKLFFTNFSTKLDAIIT